MTFLFMRVYILFQGVSKTEERIIGYTKFFQYICLICACPSIGGATRQYSRKMTDRQIIEALIVRDGKVTQQFFFKDCRPLFTSIIHKVFNYQVDYDEFVNEFYLHLMENEAHRLRQFQGRSSLYQWLKVVAIRYFIDKRDRMIDSEPEEPLIDNTDRLGYCDEEQSIAARMDVERLFLSMPNKRYVYVIKRLMIDGADPKAVAMELKISVDNLYNIKKRAIASMTEVALKDNKRYEKGAGE